MSDNDKDDKPPGKAGGKKKLKESMAQIVATGDMAMGSPKLNAVLAAGQERARKGYEAGEMPVTSQYGGSNLGAKGVTLLGTAAPMRKPKLKEGLKEAIARK